MLNYQRLCLFLLFTHPFLDFENWNHNLKTLKPSKIKTWRHAPYFLIPLDAWLIFALKYFQGQALEPSGRTNQKPLSRCSSVTLTACQRHKKISVSRNGRSSNSLWAIASKAKCQSTGYVIKLECWGDCWENHPKILLDKQGDSAMNPWHRVEVSMYLIKVILNYSMAENDKMGTLSVSWEIEIIPKIDLVEVWLKAPTHNIHNFERQWSQLISPRHR